jgi:hypothetical protein
MKALRKRYKLGEFAPKRGKRLAKRAAKRRLKTTSLEAELKASRTMDYRPTKSDYLLRMRSRNRIAAGKASGRRVPDPGMPLSPFEIR